MSNITFIFPKDPFNKSIDPEYIELSKELKNLGYDICAVDIDNLEQAQLIDKNNLQTQKKFIYIGWMLSVEKYSTLERKSNYQMLVPNDHRLNSHWSSLWHPDIYSLGGDRKFTTKSDIEACWSESKFKKALVKDYVKSLKTTQGSIAQSAQEAVQIINTIESQRGEIEGGVCLVEYMPVIASSEKRFFCLNSCLLSPQDSPKEATQLAQKIASIQSQKSLFFSIDVAQTENGQWVLIEVGDAQVSDPIGFSKKDYAVFINENISNIQKPESLTFKGLKI